MIVKLQAWARGNRVRKQMVRTFAKFNQADAQAHLDPSYMYQSAKGNYAQNESSFGAGMVGQNYMGREGVSDTENEDWDNPEPASPHEDYSRCENRPEFVFESGARYNGQWMNNMRHGFGVQVWPDGARYEGYWKNNKAHG